MPNEPKDTTVVDRAIINFTQTEPNAEEVVIAFFQIGDTFDGGDFCRRLDDKLVAEGARYDIVTTQDFSRLKERGLTSALIEAVIDTKLTQQAGGAPGKGNPAADRRELERRLLEN